MAKYKRRSTVEAFQWWPNKFPNIVQRGFTVESSEGKITRVWGEIQTKFGKLYMLPGDWVITEEDGTQSVCRADQFQNLFEPLK